MNVISRDEVLTLQADGDFVLVEALPEPHYDAEHIPGAVNLPGELTAGLAVRLVPDRDRTVVTYCSGPFCGRSKAAAAAFIRLGYTDVRVYTGGKTDWAEAGLPFDGTRAAQKTAS
jgi:rhodanese-related sulfurtransferase